MKNIRNKKTILAIAIVGILGIIGGTYAYFSSSDTFDNLFESKSYILQAVEHFKSPEGWAPGDTTAKTAMVTNDGEMNAAVRIEVTEEWKDASNNTLPLTYDSDNNLAAIVNYTVGLDDYWIKSIENGKTYYYYKTMLTPGESTITLISSVTFNPEITKSFADSCTEDTITHTKICNSTATGYIGGSYNLTLNIETVQYDNYASVWGTSVEIKPAIMRIISGDLDTIGSEVQIANERFYVVGKEDSTHVKLLTKYNLGCGKNYDKPTNRQDPEATAIDGGKGSMTFMNSSYYYDYSTRTYKDGYPKENIPGYEHSYYVYTTQKENGVYLNRLAEYVENYVGYINSLGFNATGRLVSYLNLYNTYTANSINVPSWVTSTRYWYGTNIDYSGIMASWSNNTGMTNYNGQYNNWGGGVRPVIIMEIPTN